MLSSFTKATGVSLVSRAFAVPQLSLSAASCADFSTRLELSVGLIRSSDGLLLMVCLDSSYKARIFPARNHRMRR